MNARARCKIEPSTLRHEGDTEGEKRGQKQPTDSPLFMKKNPRSPGSNESVRSGSARHSHSTSGLHGFSLLRFGKIRLMCDRMESRQVRLDEGMLRKRSASRCPFYDAYQRQPTFRTTLPRSFFRSSFFAGISQPQVLDFIPETSCRNDCR